MSVRIVYEDIAAGAAEDAAVTASGASSFSDPALLPFGGDRTPIATLEPFRWLLDGSREILDGQPIAFWSAEMSGPDGQFARPPEITITFDEKYTSPGLFLVFDPPGGEYCTRLSVEWYQGSVLLKKGEFFPAGPEFFCAQTVEFYDRIVLRLKSTSLPHRYARLTRVDFGVSRTFERDELRDVKVVEEVSLISSEVAVNTLNFTLDSKSGVEYLFQFKQPVSACDGETLIGTFYISSSVHRSAGLYSVSCIDAIGVLDEDTFPAAVYSGKNARELVEEILDGRFPLEMETALGVETVTGYLPECTRREALQQVAFALRAMVDTSGTDAVRVYRSQEGMPRRIPLSRTYVNGTVDTAAIVTAVRVTAHSYSTGGEGSDTVEVGGVTYFHTASVTEIVNPNATASDKRNVIEVKEATLVNPANAPALVQYLYDYYTRRDTQRIRIVLDGEKPGDHVAAATPWGTVMDGRITSMSIVLSGIAAADCEIVGVDVRTVGETEAIVSGEFDSGEV